MDQPRFPARGWCLHRIAFPNGLRLPTFDDLCIIGVVRAALRFAVPLLLLHPLQGQNWWLREAGYGARVIVETGVTCDVLPGARITIPLGMPIRAAEEVKEGSETLLFGISGYGTEFALSSVRAKHGGVAFHLSRSQYKPSPRFTSHRQAVS